MAFQRGFFNSFKYICTTTSLFAAPGILRVSNSSNNPESPNINHVVETKPQNTVSILSEDGANEAIKIVKDTYNDPLFALNYSMQSEHDRKEKLQLLKNYVDALPKAKHELNLLDIGCGSGSTISATIESIIESAKNIKRCNVIGMDIAKTMLDIADQHLDFIINIRHKDSDLIVNYKLIEGDMRRTVDVIGGKSFYDGIVSFYAIIHVPRQYHQDIIQQWWKLLNDDGILCLIVGSEDLDHEMGEWDGKQMFWSQYSQDGSIHLIEKCGFTIIESQFIWDSLCWPDNPEKGHLFVLAQKN